MSIINHILDTLNIINTIENISPSTLPKYINNNTKYKDNGSNRYNVNKICQRWNEYVDLYDNNHNNKFHKKGENIFRIVTFNVRFGQDRCNNEYNYKKILEFVEKVSPDIICLQETPTKEFFLVNGHEIKPFFKKESEQYFSKMMKKMGYNYDYCLTGESLANSIFYKKMNEKIKFNKWELNKNSRCMTGISINNINIITLHLEIDSNTRLKNAENFVNQLKNTNIDIKNTIIMGDFNSKLDSDILNKFTDLGLKSAIKHKLSTTSLFNTIVDHVLIHSNMEEYIDDCDIYLFKHSDHFPIIMDLKLPIIYTK